MKEWLFPMAMAVVVVCGALFIATLPASAYPSHRTFQVAVDTSGGQILCSFEEFSSGNPRVLFIGCDAGQGGGA